MKFDIATICDAATVDNGKMNVLGSFDKIFSKAVPAIHPSCALALKIRFETNKPLPKKMRIEIVDGDNKEVTPALEFEFGEIKKNQSKWSIATFSFGLLNLTFQKFGEHRVVIKADSKKTAEIFFDVVKVEV